MNQERLIPWTRPGWFEQASVWVHVELERWGIEVSGPIEQPHSRPWSAVLRAAYLEPWTRYGSREDLLGALDLAGRLASINGALTWHRSCRGWRGARREEYAEPVATLLQEFLDAGATDTG